MRKKSFCWLLVGTAMLTSCASDENTSEQKTTKIEANKTYVLTVNASKGTRALSTTDNTLNATWERSTEHVDQIYVKYVDNLKEEDWFNGALTPNASGATARLDGEVSLPSGQESVTPVNLKFQFPSQEIDYSSQGGTLTSIGRTQDYAVAMVENFQIEDGHISPVVAEVPFYNLQAIVKFTLTDKSNPSTPLNVSSLRISATNLETFVWDWNLTQNETEVTITTDSQTGDITIQPSKPTTEPLFAALRGIEDVEVMLTAKAGTDVYVYKKSGVTFSPGQYYAVNVKMTKLNYESVTLSMVTDDYVGSVVGANGKIYPDKNAAEDAGTTAVAMIAYVGNESNCSQGLAIALTDETYESQYQMSQSAASNTINGKASVLGGTWRLPTRQDWQYMFIGCGNRASYTNTPSTPINYTCFNAKLATMGTALTTADYWTNTPHPTNGTYYYYLSITNGKTVDMSNISLGTCRARACLAF